MDVKSLIIGFLLAACLFMLMGNTRNPRITYGSVRGRYEVSVAKDAWAILDTQTGVARIVSGGKVTEMRYQ